MRDDRRLTFARRLVRGRARAAMFDPAALDWQRACAERRARATSRLARAAIGAWFAAGLAALVLDCLRVQALEQPRRLADLGGPGVAGSPWRAAIGARIVDVRYSLRLLWRTRAVTAAAVVALALGLGVNVAVFAVVDALLLRPLPVPDPGALVAVYGDREGTRRFFSHPDYLDLRDGQRTLPLAALGLNSGWLGATSPEPVSVHVVSGNFFDVLGIRAARGRALAPADDAPGGTSAVAVISDALWRSRFAGAPAAIGRPITLNDRTLEIVGVAPASFRGLLADAPADLWVPFAAMRLLEPDWNIEERGEIWITLVGRLPARTSRLSAEAALAPLAVGLRQTRATRSVGDDSLRLVPMRTATFDPGGRRAIWPVAALLTLVAAGVLLIACANVASLLLARAASRTRELGLCSALGATRSRIVAQLLVEAGLLVGAGAAAGVAVARVSLGLLVAVAPPAALPPGVAVALDTRVQAFAILAAVLTVLLAGLLPAVRASRPDPLLLLRTDAVGRASPAGPARLRQALVVGQVALSLVLLIGAGLFARTLAAAGAVDPGFEPDRVLLVSVNLAVPHYTPDQMRTFYSDAASRVRDIPGVEAVGFGQIMPMSGGSTARPFLRDDVAWPPPDGEDATLVPYTVVGPGYFRAIGATVRGREFDSRDTAEAAPVVIVNETLARRLWPEGDAVGHHVRVPLKAPGPLYRVIGVVRDAKYRTLTEPQSPFFYLAVTQSLRPRVTLAVRTAGQPAAMAPAVRAVLASIDPRVPVYGVRTLASLVERSLAARRLAARLLGLFGLIALAVAGVGVYGTLAFTLTRRSSEIGVRLALGATSRDIVRLVVASGLYPVIAGLTIGAGLSLVAARLVGRFLFGVTPTDPVTFAGVCLLLAVVAGVASYVPARRATRLNPANLLRE
jgi:macrolide transport system ATP-binding/permease protein